MSSITTGGKTTTYAYDADGIRTTKVVGGVTHEYLTLNGKVVYEKIGTGNTAKIMVFTYDAQGRPFAVKYSKNNGESFTNYFYALNLQGDVVKIFRPNAVKDANETIIGYTERTYATYSYNAWGELTGITDSNGNSILNKQTTSTALANLNPLRYRGYYYDNETGFYYLQSRYYDPANRRFINADVFMSTNITNAIGCNMFAYCTNNPVVLSDPSGMFFTEAILGIVLALCAASLTGCSKGQDSSVVLCSEEWIESSQTMGNALAKAIGAQESRIATLTDENIIDTWSGITESYVAIHTHGSANGISGDNFSIRASGLSQFPTNYNIKYVIITACSTGGDNGDSYNVGQTISTKISPDGFVICCTEAVCGESGPFRSEFGGAWNIYQNGAYVRSPIETSFSMGAFVDELLLGGK